LIQTPYSDPSSNVSMGTTAAPTLVFEPTNVVTTLDDQTANPAVIQFPNSDFLIFDVHPAMSSQGSGLLVYQYRS